MSALAPSVGMGAGHSDLGAHEWTLLCAGSRPRCALLLGSISCLSSACSAAGLLHASPAQPGSGAALQSRPYDLGPDGLTRAADGLWVRTQAHVPGLFPRRQLDVGTLLVLRLRRLPCYRDLHVPRTGDDVRLPVGAQVNLKERDGFVIAPFTVRTVAAHRCLAAVCLVSSALAQCAALRC